MTYDELLTEVVAMGTGNKPEDLIDVIGAVITFHKPITVTLGKDTFTMCEGCGEADYPCKTIKILEKELA